ncbi:MAG: serine/threonine-protein phosphatase [Eubacterium sp.]|nr:serine/threonine-protein phosphatase [Eubacterium sp.]
MIGSIDARQGDIMEYAALCDIGKMRSINQDAVFAAAREDTGLFLVADGMGGHSNGEKASRQIVTCISQWWEGFRPQDYDYHFMEMMHGLRQAAKRANEEIYDAYNQGTICGSTMSLLLICGQAYGILSAGDSRIYLYYEKKIRQLTTDEIWENQPDLTPWERELHWEQYHGRLCNAVGIRRELRCSMITDTCRPGQVFLLCSDGLYRYCPKRYLKTCMKKTNRNSHPERTASMLLEKTYHTNARDNISAVLVKV